MHVIQKDLMCLQPKTWNLIVKPPYQSLIFTQECSFLSKNSFLWLTNTGVNLFSKLTGSNYNIIKVMLAKWKEKVNWLELFVELTLVRLSHTVNSEGQPLKDGQNAKPTRQTEFHPCAVFSARALLRDGRHTKREFRTFQ